MATTFPTQPSGGLSSEAAAQVFRRLTDVYGDWPRAPLREQLVSMGEAAVPTLARGLGDHDPYVRFEAINILGELAIPKTLPLLLGFALDEHQARARWRAFWAVTRLPREFTLPRLLDATSSRVWQVRWHGALMLSMMARNEAAPVIAEAFAADDDVTRWEALNAAKSLSVPELAAPVAGFLDRSHPVHIRQEAALALGRMGGPDAYAALSRALSDPVTGVRWRAAIALTAFGERAFSLLKMQRARETDPRVSRKIDDTLKKLSAR